MKKQLIAATSAACLTLAGLATPAAADIPVTINAGAGYWFFDHEVQNMEVDDTATPYVGLEYAFNDAWAAELLFADDETDFKNGGPDADVTTWQLGMLYYGGSYIGERMRVRPYLAFGAGEIDIDANTFDTVETTLNGGVGLRWMLTERLGARVESRAIYSLDESETDILVSAGLNFWLGEIAAPAAAVAEPATAAPMDSDGDGVTDDRDRCPDTAPGTRVDADGCPLPVAQVASVRLLINFDTDSSVVKERYFNDLNELAMFLKRFQDLQVDVEGHTDSRGTDAYNQSLSQRRAQAVVDTLVNDHGIARNRLQARGYGESRPIATNDTPEGRAENRRVMATLEVEYEEE